MGRERMTPEAARHFNGYSGGNAMLVRFSLKCACLPYEDVFTLKRWNAQGFKVRKGEHSIEIPVVGTSEREVADPETGEVKTDSRRFMGTGRVFCRCQVEPMSEKMREYLRGKGC